MDLIRKPEESLAEVKRCIETHGSKAEHNLSYFLIGGEGAGEPVFLKGESGYGALAVYYSGANEAFIISEPLAPEEEQLNVLHDAVDTLFKEMAVDKVVVEQDDAARSRTGILISGNGYRRLRPRYSLYWPVFDLREWDGDSLQGESWKKLRNIRNKFYREHSVKVVDSSTVDKNSLREIVREWVARRKLMSLGANRKDSNFAYAQKYHSLIDRNFDGVKLAKTMVVDGVPSSITAGWEIPNSNGEYYSAVGVYNYRSDGLGEMANLDDLNRLKEAGYTLVDFGGSPMPLLKFKLKFKPHFVYVTHTYAIVKK